MKVGDRVYVEGRRADLGPVRLMAFADGYAMVRYPHAVPFAVSIKKLVSPYSVGDSGRISTQDGGKK